jgi:dolichol-phosphate mannosyltransferase
MAMNPVIEQPAVSRTETISTRSAVVLIVASFLLRLIFSGLQELLPEEAYYWQFSRHLDWSYLDHPPMVAWLIRLGTSIFGQNEFAVRFGASLCSILTAGVLWKLSLELFDRNVALFSVLLFSALPYFFMNGFLVTPDAPLVLMWTSCLLFLVYALRDDKKLAWLGMGACLGLGMLSKYTIALLGIGTIIFLIIDSRSRKWFFSPLPYAAALLSLILFIPVLFWNSQHEWASFAFQTSRRLEEPTEFGLHVFIGALLCLLTPSGALAAASSLRGSASASTDNFKLKFLRVFVLLPFFVFLFFSFRHVPKINWTGPAFILALPFIAASVSTSGSRFGSALNRSWKPTLIILAVMYVLALGYFSGLLPFKYSPRSQRYLSWEDLGTKISAVAGKMEQATGRPPLIVGMDKHFIASELAFYMLNSKGRKPIEDGSVAGRSLFHMNSLMWHFWEPSETDGKDFLLVARSRSDLEFSELQASARELGPIEEIETQYQKHVTGKYYFRALYGFRKLPAPLSSN